MARTTAIAFATLASLATVAIAAPPEKPGPTPPGAAHAPASSHHEPASAEHQPLESKQEPKAVAKADGKTPWMSAWRKSYIAKHGHAPGAAPKTGAAKALPKYKRCT